MSGSRKSKPPSALAKEPDGQDFYRRVKALCCQAWGLPPWEFDSACDAGQVKWCDVRQLLELTAMRDPFASAWFQLYFDSKEPAGKRPAKSAKQARHEHECLINAVQLLRGPFETLEQQQLAERLQSVINKRYGSQRSSV